jgi:hypothetical protein
VIPLLDLDESIAPGVGLGGLRLGTHVSDLRDVLFCARGDAFDARVLGFWQVRYRIGQAFEWTDEELLAAAEWPHESVRRRERGLEPVDLATVVAEHPPPVPAIEIGVDVRDGVVFSLSALGGYSGTLFGTLRPGMLFGEARAADSRVRFDYALDEATIEGLDDVVLSLSESDPEPSYVDELRLEEISVFLPERGRTLAL